MSDRNQMASQTARCGNILPGSSPALVRRSGIQFIIQPELV